LGLKTFDAREIVTPERLMRIFHIFCIFHSFFFLLSFYWRAMVDFPLTVSLTFSRFVRVDVAIEGFDQDQKTRKGAR
jgi:hypothetical protein